MNSFCLDKGSENLKKKYLDRPETMVTVAGIERSDDVFRVIFFLSKTWPFFFFNYEFYRFWTVRKWMDGVHPSISGHCPEMNHFEIRSNEMRFKRASMKCVSKGLHGWNARFKNSFFLEKPNALENDTKSFIWY